MTARQAAAPAPLQQPPAARTGHGPAPVTVVIDRQDDPQVTAAALGTHAPAEGRITVHPTPAVGTPAALAQDVLHALGKTIIGTGEQHGTWADSLQPAWAAAAAWTSAHSIDHLIVTRTHQLTTRRIQQLLELRRRTGIRLTLLWHTRPTHALTTALDDTEHRMTEDLHSTLPQLQQHPTAQRDAALQLPSDDNHRGRYSQAWIAPPPPRRGHTTPRPPRARCPGADHATPPPQAHSPTESGNHDETTDQLAARLNTLAHPLYAAALATTILTGASTERLALLRSTDISTANATVKIHDGPTHRRCRLHPTPAWARPLLHAATLYHHQSGRPPEATVFPLITSRGGNELATHARAVRLHLSR
ncbi:hypothetical protein GCM10020221_08170 [Streptomyces thioluteus]|uniref:Uncharacterized protein n=1 Tax=Streptomyces thioluteus TaxID=66431 RepID=A0ABP6IZC0_STRTU